MDERESEQLVSKKKLAHWSEELNVEVVVGVGGLERRRRMRARWVGFESWWRQRWR